MRRSFLRLTLLLALALGLLPTGAAAGATITVTTTEDVIADDGKCSLREAVIAANTDAPFGGCMAGSGADVIQFSAGLPAVVQITLLLAPGGDDDAGLTGDLDVTGPTLFEGRAAGGLVVSGAGKSGLLEARPGARVELRNFELRDGGPGTAAVAIRSTAWVTVTNSTVANALETGMSVEGRLTLLDSRLSGNQTPLYMFGGRADLRNTNIEGGAGWGIFMLGGALVNADGGRISGLDGGVSNGGTAQLRSLMIDGNRGPAIVNQGVLTLQDSVIANNQSATTGGLVNSGNAARATVLRTRFTNNSGAATGGALSNTGNLTIEASTLDGNSARSGGAIYHNGASLKLTNVTITGNTATDNGGGIYAMRETTLNYVTLAGNTAGGMGGNLFVDEAQVAVAGSLLAREGAKENCSLSAGTLNLLGGNLADDTSCAPMPGAANLMLAPLAYNGGATPTRALLPGSPAIDAGTSAFCPAADQRGVTRPQGAACDAGAYEVGGTWYRLWLPLVMH